MRLIAVNYYPTHVVVNKIIRTKAYYKCIILSVYDIWRCFFVFRFSAIIVDLICRFIQTFINAHLFVRDSCAIGAKKITSLNVIRSLYFDLTVRNNVYRSNKWLSALQSILNDIWLHLNNPYLNPIIKHYKVQVKHTLKYIVKRIIFFSI